MPKFLKIALVIIVIIFLAIGYLYLSGKTKQPKNNAGNIETENIFCRENFTVDVLKINNIDVVKRIIEIWEERDEKCNFPFLGVRNIGIAKRISADGKIYNIIIYDKDNEEQKNEPFDYFIDQYEINLINNTIFFQSPFNGSFFEAGKFKKEEITSDWEIYRNEEYGFEVKYPAAILQLNKKTKTLSHTLKNFHKYSAKDGSDLGLASDISVVFKKNNEDNKGCDWLETKGGLGPIGVSFEFKNIKGVKYETGAEGEGVIYYCVKNKDNQNIFLIERWFLNNSYSTDLSKQKDYINNQKQEEIFNQILSTFKFTK